MPAPIPSAAAGGYQRAAGERHGPSCCVTEPWAESWCTEHGRLPGPAFAAVVDQTSKRRRVRRETVRPGPSRRSTPPQFCSAAHHSTSLQGRAPDALRPQDQPEHRAQPPCLDVVVESGNPADSRTLPADAEASREPTARSRYSLARVAVRWLRMRPGESREPRSWRGRTPMFHAKRRLRLPRCPHRRVHGQLVRVRA